MILLLAAATLSCPVEDAHYALRADPTVTAEFHPVERTQDWPSGVALAIHVGKTGRTYWWLPWNGGTDDGRHIRATRQRPDGDDPAAARPRGDLDFWALNADYSFADDEGVVAAGDRSPAHLLVPMLGGTLWHATTEIVRDSVPRSFFDLVARGSANAPAHVDLPAVP